MEGVPQKEYPSFGFCLLTCFVSKQTVIQPRLPTSLAEEDFDLLGLLPSPHKCWTADVHYHGTRQALCSELHSQPWLGLSVWLGDHIYVRCM